MKTAMNCGKIRLLFLVVLLGLAIAVLSGCTGAKINKDNFDKIRIGMTQEEVQRLLGPPTEATGVEIPIFSGTASKWVQGDTIITIQFVNGKVMAKEFSHPAKN